MSMAQLRAIVRFADNGELQDCELWLIHDLAVVAIDNGDVDANEVLLEVDSLI